VRYPNCRYPTRRPLRLPGWLHPQNGFLLTRAWRSPRTGPRQPGIPWASHPFRRSARRHISPKRIAFIKSDSQACQFSSRRFSSPDRGSGTLCRRTSCGPALPAELTLEWPFGQLLRPPPPPTDALRKAGPAVAARRDEWCDVPPDVGERCRRGASDDRSTGPVPTTKPPVLTCAVAGNPLEKPIGDDHTEWSPRISLYGWWSELVGTSRVVYAW
jgi:hypothetical protein